MNWIIVTGDSGSLGSAVCRIILDNGKYGVIGISRKQNDTTIELAAKYKNYTHINFDLSNPDGIKDLYKEQIKKIGFIYGVVNNSALAYDDIVTNANYDRLEQMFKVNVLAPIMLSKYAIRDMILHKIKGSLVHISSVSAHTGYKGLSMYASTKGALEAFSNNVAREWGVKGVRSNCVAPGFMETQISSSLTDEQRGKIYQRTSLKKATSIESVAEMIYFLLDEKSGSLTGEVIRVDNGTI